MESNFLKDLTVDLSEPLNVKPHSSNHNLKVRVMPATLPFKRFNSPIETSVSAKKICHNIYEQRYQVQEDILINSKQCQNSTYKCTLLCVKGYDFCYRHILRDSNANTKFTQCNYTYANGRRCGNAVLRTNTDSATYMKSFCIPHQRQLCYENELREAPKRKVKMNNNDSILNILSRHINVDDMQNDGPILDTPDPEDDGTEPFATPFIPHEQIQSPRRILQSISNEKEPIECAVVIKQETQSEKWPSLEQAKRGHDNWNESDDENNNNEYSQYEALKYAGIYTDEEVVCLYGQKLHELKQLYMNEVSRLSSRLKEEHGKYVQDMTAEKKIGSIHTEVLDTPEECRMYMEYLAYNNYHKRDRAEQNMHQKKCKLQSKPHFSKSIGVANNVKCIYTEDDIRCDGIPMPCTKFCRKHIIRDPDQVLFKPCGVEKVGFICHEPVLPFYTNRTCVLHMDLPEQRKAFFRSKHFNESNRNSTPNFEHDHKESHSDDTDSDSNDSENLPLDEDGETSSDISSSEFTSPGKS